jgi:hypothetical protein
MSLMGRVLSRREEKRHDGASIIRRSILSNSLCGRAEPVLAQRGEAEGKVALVSGGPNDRAWLAEAHPERAAAVRKAVKGLAVADRMAEAGKIGKVGV